MTTIPAVTACVPYFLPKHDSNSMDFNPDDWIDVLKDTARSITLNPAAWLNFKKTKKVLKEAAKNGQLTQKQREAAWEVLKSEYPLLNEKKKEFPTFSLYTTKPNVLLFTCPRLWNIRMYPASYPREAAMINRLSPKVIDSIIFKDERSNLSIGDLAELTYVIHSLNLYDDVNDLKETLLKAVRKYLHEDRGNKISITTYLILNALGLNTQNCKLLYDRCSMAGYCFSKSDVGLLGAELELFNQVIDGSDKNAWQNFSPMVQLRFFYYLQYEVLRNPFVCNLREEVFNTLLLHLRDGQFNDNYIHRFIDTAKKYSELGVKKERLTIDLEGIGKIDLPLWDVCAMSNFICKLVRSGEKKHGDEISLIGSTAKTFAIVYRAWSTCDTGIGIDRYYSLKELTVLLEGIVYLQIRYYDYTSAIAKAILKNIFDDKISVVTLASRLNCKELNDEIFAFLNMQPFLTCQDEDGQKSVMIKFVIPPSFTDLTKIIHFINLMHSAGMISKIEIETSEIPNGWQTTLFLLYCHYCCHTLNLEVKKTELEKQLLSLSTLDGEVEKTSVFSAFDVLSLLKGTSDPLLSHLIQLSHDEQSSSHKWTFIKFCLKNGSMTELRTRMDRFEKIIADKSGESVYELSGADLPQYIVFYLDRTNYIVVLNKISKKISSCLMEKSISSSKLLEAIMICRKVLPACGEVRLSSLKVELKYLNSTIGVSLEVMLQSEKSRAVLDTGVVKTIQGLHDVTDVQKLIDSYLINDHCTALRGPLTESKAVPKSSVPHCAELIDALGLNIKLIEVSEDSSPFKRLQER